MKYLVLKCWTGDTSDPWVNRTVAFYGAEPMIEPTEHERVAASHERALEELHSASAGGRRRRPRGGSEPSIDAWDIGCRTVIFGIAGDSFMTCTKIETINNYLDAINLVDAT